jgi:adenylate cyclase
LSGQKIEALMILDELKSSLEKDESLAFGIAVVYVGLGDKEKALDWLERALAAHNSNFAHLKCDPIFKTLRNEPRFLLLLKKVGLVN